MNTETETQDTQNTIPTNPGAKPCEPGYDWAIGTREGEDWTQVLTPGEDYTYADGLIVLNGAAIKAKGLDHLELHAELFLPGLEEAYRDDWRNCQVREAYTDYWPEQDRDMLPGWRQTIDCWRDGRIENSRNIDGRDFRYRVTDVRSSDPNVVEIEKKYENEDPNAEHVWWDYIAQGAGEAEITVEYTIIGFEQNEDVDMTGEPETGSFTFRINVGGDVYRVDLWTEDGSEMALPGDTVTLLTHGWHDFLNEEGQQEGTDEGLVYEWELEDWCSEFAELMPDPQDPQQARLTLNVPEEIEGYHQEVWVKVHLFDGADEMTGETLHRAENRIRIEVNSEYPEVWPAAIDGDLDMGCRMMIWPELRYYRYGEDGYETRPAHYRWYYDPNAIEIFDQDGNRVGNNDENGNYIDSEASAGEGLRFTVHRLTNWDTDIDVDVDWADPEDPNWERHEHRHYHLNQKNYNIWWERDPIEVYDDWHVTVPLNQEELGMLPRNLVVEAGVDPQENGSWYYKFEEGSVYTWDGNAITIKGPALYELLDSGAIEGYSVDSLREGRMVVGALLFYPPDSEEGILLNMNWTGINLKEACPTKGEEHRWYEEVLTPATCEETGELYQKCIKCGEERWTPIPPTGHKIVKVAAKAPTLTAYGNTEHYKCSVCGKLFSDAAGTKPTTAAKVRIAKLIDIAQASVAGLAAKTYNGKAQTQSLTLTYGGKTLAAGTDYTLNYKNNTAAGTATVTMTGKGLYGGSAQKTFKINPANLTTKALATKVTGLKDAAYTGKALTPAVTVSVTLAGSAKTLVKDTDYTVSYAGNIAAGTATVTVTGKGNYTGSVKASFQITKAKVAVPKAKTGLVFNNAAQTGVAAGANYTVKTGSATKAGSYTATVSLKDTANCTWADGTTKAKSVKWTIAKADLKTATVAAIKAQTYSGKALKPAPAATITLNKKSVALKAGTDYTVTYKNNTKAGTATVTLTGTGNYTGSVSKTFKITPLALSKATVAAVPDQEYTGSAIKPSPAVKMTVGGKMATLKAGTDYTLSYANNVEVGTATITVTGKGNFSGTKKVSFQITSTAPEIERLAGDNRVQTSHAIADELKATLAVSKFDTIIVSDGWNYPDALAGAYLASVKNAPIVTIRSALPDGPDSMATVDYVKKNLKAGGTVYILGGTGSVPESIENTLKKSGFQVKRLGGSNRYATNLMVLEEAGIPAGAEIIVCTGASFGDALSASATGKPILLVAGNALTPDQKAFLQKVKAKALTVIGTEAEVTAGMYSDLAGFGKVSRIGGATVYERSINIAKKFFGTTLKHVNIANGDNFPDGLCGGSLSALKGGPLLLVNDTAAIFSKATEYVKSVKAFQLTVYGGEGSVAEKTAKTIISMN